jgi:hypothetical protein
VPLFQGSSAETMQLPESDRRVDEQSGRLHESSAIGDISAG